MFHMVPGGTTVRSGTSGQDAAIAEQLRAILERMNQILERLQDR
jgi:hypothetical protein